MSILKVAALKSPSSSSNNIVLNSDGSIETSTGGSFVSNNYLINSGTFTSNTYITGTFTSNAYINAEKTGTAIFPGFAGSTIILPLVNNNKVTYPQTSDQNQDRVADASDPTQFTDQIFDGIEGNDDFDGPYVTFSNNSFTVTSGVTVGLCIQWATNDNVSYSISQTGDWSGNSSVAFGGGGNTNPQFYTATGPGTFTFGPFFRTSGSGGASFDLKVLGVIVESVTVTANVSL
jgi:hypothetical protein